MLLMEMFTDEAGDFQDVSQDQSVPKINDLRKSRLTLGQINQLRKMNDQRMVEYMADLKKVKQQYGAPPAPVQ
jgi:hypothetical protein